MTITPVSRGLAAAAAATLLLLTACTAGDEPTGSGTGSTSSSDEPQRGPLEEYMAKAGASGMASATVARSQGDQEDADERGRRMESLIAACMSDEGFDYTPRDLSSTSVTPGRQLDVEWGSREFAEKYGYGISTDPWGIDDSDASADSGASDPNEELLAGMSDGERDAFETALYGAPRDESALLETSQVGEANEYDWRSAGCMGAAQHELSDAEGASEDDADFKALQEEIAAFWRSVENSGERATIEADFASCMAEAGFAKVTSRSVALQPILTGYQELLATGDGASAGVDETELDAFRANEIKQAVADWTCADEIDYDTRVSTSSHKLQQEFVDQHEAELEAWVEAATEAGR